LVFVLVCARVVFILYKNNDDVAMEIISTFFLS